MTTPRRYPRPLVHARVWVPSAVSTVIALWSIWSCSGAPSAADEIEGPGLDWGGQTGSLLPPIPGSECGPLTGRDRVLRLAGETPAFLARGDGTPEPLGDDLLPLDDDVLPLDDDVLLLGDAGSRLGDAGLPVGDAGLPVGDAGLPVDDDPVVPTSDWYVVTESGEVVNVPEPSGAAPAVIELGEGLEPGRHQLNYSCAGLVRSVVLVIEEPQPTPVLVRNAALSYSPTRYTCSSIDYTASVTLVLDEQASLLGDTAQISLIGEDLQRVVAPFATIEPGTTRLDFGVPICPGEDTSMCIPRGTSTLNVVTDWVDSDVPSQFLSLDVDANCSVEEPEPSTEGTETSCVIARKPSKGLQVTWAIAGLLGLCRLLSRRGSRRLASR